MRIRKALLGLLAMASFNAALTWAPAARAEDEAKPRTVVLILDSGPAALPAEPLREGVERELHAAVRLADKASSGQDTLVVRVLDGPRVILTYHDGNGRVTEREIDLPDTPDRAVEVVVLLAGNLVRDEAAELAAALRKHPDNPPPAATLEAPPDKSTAAPAPRPPSISIEAEPPPRRAPPPPSSPKPQACIAQGAAMLDAGVDLVPLVGTSSAFGVDTTRRFSFNVLGGYGRGLLGVELGGIANIESDFVCGLQIADVTNISLGPVMGAQLAGLLNFSPDLEGAQTGIINIARGEVKGAQLGFVDVASGQVKGAQLGAINVARKEVRGAQLGFVDVASELVTGAQLGAVNVARKDIRGAQVGFVNVTSGQVKGAQFGFVNVADASPFSFGFINVIRNGELHVDAWGQESGLMMTGIKTGTAHFHNIFGVGMRPMGAHQGWAASLGMGGHFPLSKQLFLDADVLAYSLHPVKSIIPYAGLTQARLVLGLRVLNGLALYAGPSYNVTVAKKAEDARVSPYGVNFAYMNTDIAVEGWPGATLGAQLL